MTANVLGDSLARLAVALEAEEKRLELGQQSDPKRYVSLLLGAVQILSRRPEIRTTLNSKLKELLGRFKKGSEFDRARKRLLRELDSRTVDHRPKTIGDEKANEILGIWREALSGDWDERISRDPAQFAREIQEEFETWRLPTSTNEILLELLTALEEAAVDNAIVPMRGIVLLIGCITKPYLTLLSVERICDDQIEEYGPTVSEILTATRWIMSLPIITDPPQSNRIPATITKGGTIDGRESTGSAVGRQNALLRCHWSAYFASKYVERKVGKPQSAREVFDFWEEFGFDSSDDSTENVDVLKNYVLPSFETFKTYLSKGRAAFNDLRYEDRKGRRGRSVVTPDEID